MRIAVLYMGFDDDENKSNLVQNDKAAIVHEICVDYGYQQISPILIADKFQARGIPTPGQLRGDDLERIAQIKYAAGEIDEESYVSSIRNAERARGMERWTIGTVYSILKNWRAYAGRFSFSFAGTAYIVDVPPIIDDDLARAVEERLAVGRRRNARKPDGGPYLMARRLTCGVCKLSYTVAPKKNKSFACYYKCSKGRTRYHEKCGNRPVRNTLIDPKAQEFIRELLLNRTELFAWWQKQQEHTEQETQSIQDRIADLKRTLTWQQSKLYRTLDRLTDQLDADERYFYTQQRDTLKKTISELREGIADLERQLLSAAPVSQEIIKGFEEMGEEYNHALETSNDFAFWRGLVDDLDLTAIIGVDAERGQYVEFVLFGAPRRKIYIKEVDTDSAPSTART